MNLKQKLKNKELTIGSWISSGEFITAEIMSKSELEWIVIDLEHTSIDLERAKILISTIQSNDTKAFVRVSKNEEVIIKRALDMGADGIIAPMINSKEDMQKLIDYTYYPPKGKRGVGLYRAQGYGNDFDNYKKRLQNEIILIAQIEHINAVRNIKDILSFQELDGIIIGPYDLSGSMGKPGEFYSTDVQEAIDKVISSCKEYEKPAGFHVVESDPQATIKRIKEGCSFIAYSIDFLFLSDSINIGLKKIKENI